ncbi:MAG: hypothetical protein WBQ60_09555 [Asticcacaulis sp.]
MRSFIIASALILSASQALAQTPPDDFVGTYADGADHKIAIAANAQGQLFAIIDDADYPLTITGTDQLTNLSGEVIPFRRDKDGILTAMSILPKLIAAHPEVSTHP